MRHISNQIFGRTDNSDLVGRQAELDRLLRHAIGESKTNGLALLATPAAGTSELLRHAFDQLFIDQKEIIPYYFEIRENDGTAQNAARRFLSEFLLQTVAFRRHEAKIIAISPEIDELAELAAPSYGHWIDRLVEIYHRGAEEHNWRSFVRNCLSAPLRAAVHDARSFVIIDGLERTEQLEGGRAFFDELRGIYSQSTIPFVLAGHRRFLFAKTKFETFHVDPLSFYGAGEHAPRLSARTPSGSG